MPSKSKRLDLACGNNKQKGYVGVDRIGKPQTQADILFDLETFPWSFAKDGTYDEVFCSHYIEHTPDLIPFMGEVWRILKPNGVFKVIAPYYTSIRAWQDPTHRRVISEATFLYFNKEWMKANKLEHYGIRADFWVENVSYAVSDEYRGKSQEAVQYAAQRFWNVVTDIIVTLRKLGEK